MSYNYKKLLSEIPDETHAAKFLQNCGILNKERVCCGNRMVPFELEKPIPMWRYSSYHGQKGVRTDTWLDSSKTHADK